MKVRKPIWGFLLLILLTAVFAIVIHLISSNEMIEREDDRIQLKIDGVAKTLDSLEVEITDSFKKNSKTLFEVKSPEKLIKLNEESFKNLLTNEKK